MTQSLSFNPVLESLPVYQPGRPIEEVARELGFSPSDVVKLASNENPLGPSPKALEAMREACATAHLYPDGNGYHLKQGIARKLNLQPNQIVLGNGSNDVLELVGHALLRPADKVVVSEFCFAVYPIVTRLFGAELVEVPACDYGHDLAAMRDRVDDKTRVMFVANPNNPTGTRVSNTDLLNLVAKIPENVLLVADEAYVEFLDDPADLLSFVRDGIHPNLLITRTFSKIHGLAGLRMGYGLGHPGVIAVLEKARQPFNVNAIAQAAARAALEDDEHVVRTRENNRSGLQFLADGFGDLGLEVVPSSANFLLVRVGDGHRCFVKLQEGGVITRPMAGYGLPQWLRITVGTPAENERCLQTLKRLLTSGLDKA